MFVNVTAAESLEPHRFISPPAVHRQISRARRRCLTVTQMQPATLSGPPGPVTRPGTLKVTQPAGPGTLTVILPCPLGIWQHRVRAIKHTHFYDTLQHKRI